jgi:hypothetical protein
MSPKRSPSLVRRAIFHLAFRMPQSELEEYVEVDDQGSDVTIFAFAGLAGVFGWIPAFQFRRILREQGNNYNLVFFRDLNRLCYHLTPEGESGGLDFFTGKIQELMSSLGSSYNAAIGTSAGATAALYFGARCGLDQVISFSPFLPQRAPVTRLIGACGNLPLLVRDPHAYTLGIAAQWLYRRMQRAVGEEGIWRVVDMWRRPGELPKAVIYYGERCREDANVARQFGETGNIECVPLPTSSHYTAQLLKDQGGLAGTILGRIRDSVAASRRDA